jgi:trehalose-phosphatase
VAQHVRQLAPTLRTQAEQALQGIAEDARREGLHTIAGRAVLEARPPLSDKGHSLAQIRARVAPGSFLIYAGDDATDEPALRLAAHEGMAVFIASPERSAPSGIDGLAITTQRDWCIALCQLAQPYG